MASSSTVRPGPVPSQVCAVYYAAITPSDSVNFTDGPCDSIYCSSAGIVQAVRFDDVVVPFTVVAGQTLNIKAKRVNSTSTTSQILLVAMYVR